MARRLLFMADYSADPLWDLESEAMVALERLPLTEATRASVRAWASRWEAIASSEFDLVAAEVPKEACATLERDGRAVWQQVRRELGDDWQVGWVTFPNGRRHVQWHPKGPTEPCSPGATD